MNNSEESLTPEKMSADNDTPAQTDLPAGQSISTADNVEMQRHFNELRGELLDKRAVSIDRLKPDFAEAYNNRGVAKAALGQRAEAITDFDEAIRLKPDFAEAYYNRGITKAELDHHEDAITDYDEAIHLKPDYAKAYNNRGVGKAALGQRTEAIADYDKAIRLQPDFAEAYYNRGNAKAVLNLIDEARQDFENARDVAREASNDSLADLAEQRLRGLDSQEDE